MFYSCEQVLDLPHLLDYDIEVRTVLRVLVPASLHNNLVLLWAVARDSLDLRTCLLVEHSTHDLVRS